MCDCSSHEHLTTSRSGLVTVPCLLLCFSWQPFGRTSTVNNVVILSWSHTRKNTVFRPGGAVGPGSDECAAEVKTGLSSDYGGIPVHI